MTASWISTMLATYSWTSVPLATDSVLAVATVPDKKMKRGPRHVKQIAHVLLLSPTAMILLLWRLMPTADGLLTIKSDIDDPHSSAELIFLLQPQQ